VGVVTVVGRCIHAVTNNNITAHRVMCKMLISPEEGIHQCLQQMQLSFIKQFLGLRGPPVHELGAWLAA
jgi:hypothetical protein